jgi:hypothetical protein
MNFKQDIDSSSDNVCDLYSWGIRFNNHHGIDYLDICSWVTPGPRLHYVKAATLHSKEFCTCYIGVK